MGNPLSREERIKFNENLEVIEQEFSRFGQVKLDFDRVVAEAGSNNPEVVLARGKQVNLNERLDKTDAILDEKASRLELDIVKAQTNNLIAHAGNTDGNSELLDMRVAFDGVTYATAGEAMRALANYMIEENEPWEGI